ncbi:MAG: T9SS type A sorting domain-containing protein [Ignavibacteriae bacterium]|nr:T9SS type A sorting domain-containing protein [Ignavibacteriota bacterium]
MTAVESYSQFTRPVLPRLSLTGVANNYETDFYPDGRIWVPPSVSGAREFLMPVFITNNWYSYRNAQGAALYTVDPIRSFSFSVFYNEKAIRFIGVETVNSVFNDPGYEPLAQQFYIDAEDKLDDYYWYYINPNKWADTRDNLDGRRVTFNGTSMGLALPNTDLDVEEFKVLFYVRFRVMAERQEGQGGAGFNLIQTTPIYIDNRSVKYNDLDVAKQNSWLGFTDYDINNYQNLYSRPIIGNGRGRLDGDLFYPDTYLDGMNNAPTAEDDNLITLPGPLSDDGMYKAEPVYPGVITLKISDDIPSVRVASVTDDAFPIIQYEQDQSGNELPTMYELPTIVLVDDNSPEQFGLARMKISNSTSKSRLQNIWFETDAAWLEMHVDDLNENRTLTFPRNQRRYGFAQYLDNSILGEELDPVMKPTNDDGDVYIRLQCDPTKLPPRGDGEPHGVHIGYVTIKSDYARVSPIRVKVLFLFMKNPYEPDWNKAPGNPGGINIIVRNSAGAGGEERRLVFGTGTRATDGIDLLYGEAAYNVPLSTANFDARWFPLRADLLAQYPFGFGDVAPNAAAARTVSRDIRAYNMPKGQNSHIYEARFFNPANAYPISVEWNINDFPQGAQLFIRQVVNGVPLQATDMRFATQIDQFRRSITIADRNVTSFRIEYTLPTTMDFVDENGDPIIKRGWNLLSLPLAPTNTVHNVVYKNAINVPWAFVNSQYQERPNLRVGEGFFLKYSSQVDVSFAGSIIDSITKDRHNVRIWAGDFPDPQFNQFFGGWNLIGALSNITSIDGIRFYPTSDNQLPSLAYTKQYGVYGYRTDLGYFEVSNMVPGLGYWIKASSDGFYGLNPTYQLDKQAMSNNTKLDMIERSTKITMFDNAQHRKDIYVSNDQTANTGIFELPPVFSEDMFDVRFNNNGYFTNDNESVIRVQGVTYPVSFNIEKADADYLFVDPVTNQVYGTIKAGTNGNVTIDELPFGAVKMMKRAVAGEEFAFTAFPVPANDFTNVNFTITDNDFVSVKLFDALGNEIADFINEYRTKGDYTETISLKNINTGSYILRLTSGTKTSVVKINVIR